MNNISKALRFISMACLVLVWPVVSVAQNQQLSSQGAMFTTLVNFDGTNGANPYDTLVQGTDGNLYGTTYLGGALSSGEVFKMTPGGSLTVIHSFCAEAQCADGSMPYSLALGFDGDFYGTNIGGASNGAGTIFEITPNGKRTTLYNFSADVAGSIGVVLGADGNFYGTSDFGGLGYGTAFKITPNGTLTTLYDFCSEPSCADRASPSGLLTQASDGNFYGTTQNTIFKINPQGHLTTLDSFGSNSPLAQEGNGNFNGTEAGGGAFMGALPSNSRLRDVRTTIYNFCEQANCADGSIPSALVLGSDGNFYGVTFGGTNTACLGGCGTVFRITPGGTLTTLYDFDATDGPPVVPSLMQHTNGVFYGLNYGIENGAGTAFALSVGLDPFVKTVPALGKAGETITILGTDLTGTISVDFNGTPAEFAVHSETLISATVPAGASSGFLTVTTPSATLTSNMRFQVRP